MAALAAGCGGDDSPRPVGLTLVTPADGAVVHTGVVEVRGRVSPAGARVLVAGRPAAVTGAEFRGRVRLREGSNVIDVGASADGARTTWSALRVARQTLVRVPDLAGVERDEALDRLRELGLRAEVEESRAGCSTSCWRRAVACARPSRARARSCRAGRASRVTVARGC